MKYEDLKLSRNGIIKILERNGDVVIYQGRMKKAPEIENVDVLSVNEVGGITEIVLALGKTKEERLKEAEEKREKQKASHLVSDFKKRVGMTMAVALASVGDWL